MRVFNADKTQELRDYDSSLGYTKEDKLITHISRVEGIEEKGHYKVIKEFSNGGKEYEWVIDVPRIEPIEEHDEIEDILIYIPYTEEEVRRQSLLNEKLDIEQWLRNHDYVGIKIATGRATIEEYADIIAEMTVKAERINEINNLLNEHT